MLALPTMTWRYSGSEIMKNPYRQATAICFGVLIIGNVFAGTIPGQVLKYYRYTNEKGEVVLSNQVPPDQAVRGYEVLNKSGEVQEVVAPALTQEQRDQNALDKVRKENDKRLRSLYSSYEEIDQARDLQIGKIKSAQVIIEGNIKSLISRREKIQANAAELERKGQPVPPDVSKTLFDIENHIKIENKKLQDQKDLEQSELARFAADRARLGELLNLGGVTKVPDTQLRPLAEPTKAEVK